MVKQETSRFCTNALKKVNERKKEKEKKHKEMMEEEEVTKHKRPPEEEQQYGHELDPDFVFREDEDKEDEEPKEKGEASQGSSTFRRIRGSWGKGPMVKKVDKEDESPEMMPDEEKPETEKEKEIQMEIDEVVEQLAKFEIEQRKNEGDKQGHEQLSNHWLKYKIRSVEEAWKAEKRNESLSSSSKGSSQLLQDKQREK